MTISYSVINNSPCKVNLWFGVEFGFAVPWQEDANSFSYVKDQAVQTKELAMIGNAARCGEFGIRDDHLKLDINFTLDKQAQLWRFPIHTVSLSEEGLEKVQQSVVLFPNWKLQLEPQDKWQVEIINSFSLLK